MAKRALTYQEIRSIELFLNEQIAAKHTYKIQRDLCDVITKTLKIQCTVSNLTHVFKQCEIDRNSLIETKATGFGGALSKQRKEIDELQSTVLRLEEQIQRMQATIDDIEYSMHCQ